LERGWAGVRAKIVHLVSGAEQPLHALTLANAEALADFAEGRYQSPTGVDLGYWPTVCLSWNIRPAPIQIEVFEDRYEFYRFFDGHTEIKEIPHAAGAPFPPTLEEILDPLLTL
jgi:hypothetical protein